MISLSDIVVFASFSRHPRYKFGLKKHGALSFLFWVLIIVIIFLESFEFLTINDGYVYVFLAGFFSVEYFMNWNDYSGVSSNVYDFLDHLTLVCAFSCLHLWIRPTAFLADFCLSGGLMIKGTWVLLVGLNMYTHTFGLKGCQTISLLLNKDRDEIKCDLDEDGLRGIALISLLFVLHAIMVLITCFGFLEFLSSKESLRNGESSGPLLGSIESHSMLLQPLPEFEI